MKRIALGLALVGIVGVATGCNTLARQPKLRDPMITPVGQQPGTTFFSDRGDVPPASATLRPGDSAVLTCRVADRHLVVRQVTGVVQEDDRIKFKLRNDGNPPDVRAGDQIWSLQVDVPFMAPPGDFTMELTAYRSDGQVVQVKTKDGGVVPLKATCVFSVVYPEETK